MKIITSQKIPSPKGHYSACIEHNGALYISGQLPFDPKTGELPEGIKAQTLQVLKNLDLIVTEAGSSRNKVLQVQIYNPDVDCWGAVNKVYSDFFGEHRPARCLVPTRDLHYGCLIEVEATAFI